MCFKELFCRLIFSLLFSQLLTGSLVQFIWYTNIYIYLNRIVFQSFVIQFTRTERQKSCKQNQEPVDEVGATQQGNSVKLRQPIKLSYNCLTYEQSLMESCPFQKLTQNTELANDFGKIEINHFLPEFRRPEFSTHTGTTNLI